ncbi:uncharacterized protein LOC107812766 isoform X2 [Nicotiana tabacum]|uniref:Uncharacterized protein LOC107812766 isoform X2 n=1 Tax=Nicotiana tabacum TaxID=4097 RepID=A0A1S4BWZ1_TOBAC|nr:uncharacterized protein LOC104118490 isoform X2 [Nicotiana tomentosiformis]XP_016493421.1 PREDICTED: uncharacterized protein LOC107812766 isoform X2 [Nicotiana tabacum]
MEIIRIISTLLICFTLFMLSSFSFATPLLDHEMKTTLSSSPRKLKLNEQPNVKSKGDQKHLVPFNTANQVSLPGKEHEQEAAKMVKARKGTRQEWVEGKDTSDFFTMDYHWVRRRRPIHNKSIRP